MGLHLFFNQLKCPIISSVNFYFAVIYFQDYYKYKYV